MPVVCPAGGAECPEIIQQQRDAMTSVGEPDSSVASNPAAREDRRGPPPLVLIQDLISRTFAISQSTSDLSSRRTGTAAIRNVSRPVTIVTRSIRSAAAWAIALEPAHTAKDRPDATSILKKCPAPSGTPYRSLILTGCKSVTDLEASDSKSRRLSPVASPRPCDTASFTAGMRRGLFHLRLRLRVMFKPRPSLPNCSTRDNARGRGRPLLRRRLRKPGTETRGLASVHRAPMQIDRQRRRRRMDPRQPRQELLHQQLASFRQTLLDRDGPGNRSFNPTVPKPMTWTQLPNGGLQRSPAQATPSVQDSPLATIASTVARHLRHSTTAEHTP